MTLLNQLYQLQLVSPLLVSSQFTLGLLHIKHYADTLCTRLYHTLLHCLIALEM